MAAQLFINACSALHGGTKAIARKKIIAGCIFRRFARTVALMALTASRRVLVFRSSARLISHHLLHDDHGISASFAPAIFMPAAAPRSRAHATSRLIQLQPRAEAICHQTCSYNLSVFPNLLFPIFECAISEEASRGSQTLLSCAT